MPISANTAIASGRTFDGEDPAEEIITSGGASRRAIPSAIGLRAAGFLKARVNIPMHYDTFDVIRADPEEYARKAEAAGAKAVVVRPGGSYTVD